MTSTSVDGAPASYEMTGLDCTIIMHPQVWKCSGHYDMFHDHMVDCRETNKTLSLRSSPRAAGSSAKASEYLSPTNSEAEEQEAETQRKAMKYF